MNFLIEKLKKIYNYDQKTCNALSKVLPKLIEYYGNEYEDIIFSSICDCEIILCNSYETILSVVGQVTLSKEIFTDPLKENDNRYGTGLYFSSPKVKYDDILNKFLIEKINRKIIISHTYNLDSPKGLEILTYCVCSLIKSYVDEYRIEGNVITKRTGFSKEKRRIILNNNKCFLEHVNTVGIGLEKGLNIYDTEKIVSMVLNDNYKCYEYNSLYDVVLILKEKLHLKKVIEGSEINSSLDFINIYNLNNLYFKLLNLCDECMSLEQNMIIFDVTREEKDKTSLELKKKLNNDVYMNFAEFLTNRR